MFVFWQVVYMSSLFACVVILPFGYFFYETTEDKDYKSRFCLAFRNEIILIIVFSLVHFPMFSTMRHAYIPVESLSYKGLENKNPTKVNFDDVFLAIEDETIKFN